MHRLLAACVSALAVLVTPISSRAAWLDAEAPSAFNQRGAAVPAAPVVESNDDPRCRESERPAETHEDRLVMAKGWRLFHAYEAGWEIKVIWALSGYDGMCRPLGYQAFVFAKSAFAGTLSPTPMDSRTDASLFSVRLFGPVVGPDPLVATFDRYAQSDPLCCPSRKTVVRYRVDRSQAVPLLLPVAASTSTPER